VTADEFIIDVTVEVTNNLPIVQSCNTSIGVSTSKEIYNHEEKIHFNNTLTNKTLDFQIEYWIEDLFGKIVKNKIITSNLQQKSYTPKFEDKQAVFLIKNELLTSCQNVGRNASEKIVVVRNENFLEEEDEYSETKEAEPLKPKIISFYTRTKKYSPTIKLFANIQGFGVLELFSNNEKQSLKVNTSGVYELNVSASKHNNYVLILFSEGVVVDLKELQITFNETSPANSSKTIKEQETNLENKSSTQENKSEKKPLNNNILTGQIVYESKNQKIIKSTPYFLIFALILFITIMILKKKF